MLIVVLQFSAQVIQTAAMTATNVYAPLLYHANLALMFAERSARTITAARTIPSYVNGRSFNHQTLILIRFLSKSATAIASEPFLTLHTIPRLSH